MRWLSSRVAVLFACVSIILSTAASALITVGALDTPGEAMDAEVVGGLAYVADDVSGRRIVDVSNPAAPVEIGVLDTPDYAWNVGLVGAGVLAMLYRVRGRR